MNQESLLSFAVAYRFITDKLCQLLRFLRCKTASAIANLIPRRGRSTSPWKRRLRYFYWRLMRQKGSAEFLARGLAAGVFAGLFPLFGIQTMFGIGLAIPLRGSKLMAAVGTWVSNPITYGPIYFLNFEVGQWLLGSDEVFDINSFESASTLLEVGSDFLTILFVGCFLMGALSAVASYFIGVWVIRRWREPHLNWHREFDQNGGLSEQCCLCQVRNKVQPRQKVE